MFAAQNERSGKADVISNRVIRSIGRRSVRRGPYRRFSVPSPKVSVPVPTAVALPTARSPPVRVMLPLKPLLSRKGRAFQHLPGFRKSPPRNRCL